MDKPLSNWLRNLFLADGIIGALLGAALLLTPGRTLTILGWVPQWVQLPESELSVPGSTFVDGVLTRMLGAALLALAWANYQGWRAKQQREVKVILQTELVFCVFAALAAITGLVMLNRTVPPIGIIITLLLLGLSVGWGLALWKK